MRKKNRRSNVPVGIRGFNISSDTDDVGPDGVPNLKAGFAHRSDGASIEFINWAKSKCWRWQIDLTVIHAARGYDDVLTSHIVVDGKCNIEQLKWHVQSELAAMRKRKNIHAVVKRELWVAKIIGA